MNEILQKRIEEAAIKYSCSNPSEHENQMYDQTDLEWAYEAGATFALQNQWVSVEDELPPLNKEIAYSALSERVLVRINFEGYIKHSTACYDYANKRWTVHSEFVTHWMPIPELKEE